MGDVAIEPGGMQAFGPPKKVVPVYLITLETKGNKKDLHFIATKCDHATNTANATGFFTEAEEDEIAAHYTEIIAATDKTLFVEMQFPWCRIMHIRSLLYKQK